MLFCSCFFNEDSQSAHFRTVKPCVTTNNFTAELTNKWMIYLTMNLYPEEVISRNSCRILLPEHAARRALDTLDNPLDTLRHLIWSKKNNVMKYKMRRNRKLQQKLWNFNVLLFWNSILRFWNFIKFKIIEIVKTVKIFENCCGALGYTWRLHCFQTLPESVSTSAAVGDET